MENYLIRRANHIDDSIKLNELFTKVFYPEQVGILAETMFRYFPGMEPEHWFIAEERETSEMISAFALIPWKWEMEGIPLSIAEMGLVGTLENHRRKGIMRLLNHEFDKTVREEQYDLCVIQGIPGFYHRFGFHYALVLENHINIPLYTIPDDENFNGFEFRQAELSDIPFLMQKDKQYRSAYSISSVRSEQHWKYILTHGKATETGSEIWIMTNRESGKCFYFRILLLGFGTGLKINEMDESTDYPSFLSILKFCRKIALGRQKPYIRFILHNQSAAAGMAYLFGAKPGKPYAWQIKIPDRIRFMTKISPLLQRRMNESIFRNYSGIFRIDLYSECIDMIWKDGVLISVEKGGEVPATHTFCIGNDLFPACVLGHLSWEELQQVRPDVSPAMLYDSFEADDLSDITGRIVNVLFPKRKSWIYPSY